jgi:hypothetical protein
MDHFTVFPEKSIQDAGAISSVFVGLGITRFYEACRYVYELPYGYNSDRDDLMILFTEGFGSCTTKHAVIATLAEELDLPVFKHIGVYAVTETLVTGTAKILEKYRVPYLPMVHCFLVYENHRVDLSEGNRNGKNGPIDDLLYTERVSPNISGKDEYRLYRAALKDPILLRPEFRGVDLKTILKAREEELALLRAKVQP